MFSAREKAGHALVRRRKHEKPGIGIGRQSGGERFQPRGVIRSRVLQALPVIERYWSETCWRRDFVDELNRVLGAFHVGQGHQLAGHGAVKGPVASADGVRGVAGPAERALPS